MIVGVGVELIDVPRFEALLARHGSRLRARIFTTAERAYADTGPRRAESLAVRLAAKLAGRRALAVPGVALRDLEVVREDGRAPVLRLHGTARDAARLAGVDAAALTLTHDAQWCIGQVVLESCGPDFGVPAPGRRESPR